MMVVQYAIISIFFLLEIAMLVSFMYWGFHLDTSLLVKILFGIGTPILVAIIWGTFIAPKASIPVSVPSEYFYRLFYLVRQQWHYIFQKKVL